MMLGKAGPNHSSNSKNEFGGTKVGIYRPIEVEAVPLPHAQQQFGLSWFFACLHDEHSVGYRLPGTRG